MRLWIRQFVRTFEWQGSGVFQSSPGTLETSKGNSWRGERLLGAKRSGGLRAVTPAALGVLIYALMWLILLSLAPTSTCLAGDPPTAKEILEKVEDLHRGAFSHGFMTMDIKTAHWHRIIFTEFWTKGKDRTLVKILTPEKEKGTAILRSGAEVWNYLPRVNRLIKLPTSMMSAPCLGAHFTNDDLVKESRLVEQYQVDVTHAGWREGEQVLEITCVPKPGAPVIWGKIIVTVRQSDYLPVSLRYFDEEGRLVRTMTFSHLKKFDGHLVPSQVTVVVTDKPGERTILTYHGISFRHPIPDGTFNPHNLQKSE